MRISLTIILSLILISGFGQSLQKEKIETLAGNYLAEGVHTLRDFLSIPNSGKIPSEIDRNLKWCEEEFNSLDFKTSILYSDSVKYLLAERELENDFPTVLIYLQIDGQPVDAAKWSQRNPFEAVLKDCQNGECQEINWNGIDRKWNPDWRIFARSASDSKGPAVAFIQALKILQKEKIPVPFNIKVIMDFQEELGSPTLPFLVESFRDRLSADVMLIMDGTRPPGNIPTLTFGARGIATMKLTVFGPKNDMHSGQYGNFVPNPVFTLSHLLASMKDQNGRVLIAGYYDGVSLTKQQKDLINQVPENRTELLESIGIYQPESIGETYQEALQYPSFNVRGLQAGWVNEDVRTIIPSQALAEIDMRLVAETPAERQIMLVKKHIELQGYKILDSLPTDDERRKFPKLIRIETRIGSRPFKTSLDSPIGNWLGKSMDEALGEGAYVRMQVTGGSQPIEPFISNLGIPAVSIRISNPDSNIHAPNENIRIGNFHEGLKMCLSILTRKYE